MRIKKNELKQIIENFLFEQDAYSKIYSSITDKPDNNIERILKREIKNKRSKIKKATNNYRNYDNNAINAALKEIFKQNFGNNMALNLQATTTNGIPLVPIDDQKGNPVPLNKKEQKRLEKYVELLIKVKGDIKETEKQFSTYNRKKADNEDFNVIKKPLLGGDPEGSEPIANIGNASYLGANNKDDDFDISDSDADVNNNVKYMISALSTHKGIIDLTSSEADKKLNKNIMQDFASLINKFLEYVGNAFEQHTVKNYDEAAEYIFQISLDLGLSAIDTGDIKKDLSYFFKRPVSGISNTVEYRILNTGTKLENIKEDEIENQNLGKGSGLELVDVFIKMFGPDKTSPDHGLKASDISGQLKKEGGYFEDYTPKDQDANRNIHGILDIIEALDINHLEKEIKASAKIANYNLNKNVNRV